MFMQLAINFEDQRSEKMRSLFHTLALNQKFLKVEDFFETRFKQNLTQPENPEPSSSRPSQVYDLSTMEWDENCNQALRRLMDQIKPPF
ncbi:hypothetical protein F4810DRAFT_717867 [Camillea tinctor]|nr:hypothetical protein F4810DRAFT_717867 [Camillea tinctor]